MNGMSRTRGAVNPKVQEAIARLKELPEWDGKTYDAKLCQLLQELQALKSNNARKDKHGR